MIMFKKYIISLQNSRLHYGLPCLYMHLPPHQVDTAFQLAERAITVETSAEKIYSQPKNLTAFQDMVSSDLGSLGMNSEHFQRGGRACLTWMISTENTGTKTES